MSPRQVFSRPLFSAVLITWHQMLSFLSEWHHSPWLPKLSKSEEVCSSREAALECSSCHGQCQGPHCVSMGLSLSPFLYSKALKENLLYYCKGHLYLCIRHFKWQHLLLVREGNYDLSDIKEDVSKWTHTETHDRHIDIYRHRQRDIHTHNLAYKPWLKINKFNNFWPFGGL